MITRRHLLAVIASIPVALGLKVKAEPRTLAVFDNDGAFDTKALDEAIEKHANAMEIRNSKDEVIYAVPFSEIIWDD